MAKLFPKRCKIYPRNNMQFISGILENQKRIELPAELPLSEKELRRCLSYGNCFEMVGGKHILLTLENFNKDNKEGKDVTSTLPKGEVSKPRDEEVMLLRSAEPDREEPAKTIPTAQQQKAPQKHQNQQPVNQQTAQKAEQKQK